MNDLDLDNFLIKDDFYKSIEEEITCSICSGLKKDPVMCIKCQNSFCSKCIRAWENKSQNCPFKCLSPEYTTCRIINNLLSKLNFRCKNKCDEIIPFDKLESHYEYECKNINYKEKNRELYIKNKQLESKFNKLKNAFLKMLDFSLDSKIIEDPEDLVFLKKNINIYFKNFSCSLLYRATRDGDTGVKFHQLCDKKQGATLVIYLTTENYIFGGFTNATWISWENPEKKAAGKDVTGSINFLFQLNHKKIYKLRTAEKPDKSASIFCRSDCGPCFGSLGEDIWCRTDFLSKKGILHKDKDKGRKCSFETTIDYELNNGEKTFLLKELEVFLIN